MVAKYSSSHTASQGLDLGSSKFAHLPLILKPEGNGKLSKRDGDEEDSSVPN